MEKKRGLGSGRWVKVARPNSEGTKNQNEMHALGSQFRENIKLPHIEKFLEECPATDNYKNCI